MPNRELGSITVYHLALPCCLYISFNKVSARLNIRFWPWTNKYLDIFTSYLFFFPVSFPAGTPLLTVMRGVSTSGQHFTLCIFHLTEFSSYSSSNCFFQPWEKRKNKEGLKATSPVWMTADRTTTCSFSAETTWLAWRGWIMACHNCSLLAKLGP